TGARRGLRGVHRSPLRPRGTHRRHRGTRPHRPGQPLTATPGDTPMTPGTPQTATPPNKAAAPAPTEPAAGLGRARSLGLLRQAALVPVLVVLVVVGSLVSSA